MIFNPDYLDVNGLPLPSKRNEDKPADNCIMFGCIARMLNFDIDIEAKIKETFLEIGLLPRWKGNNFDQSAWDDYLAVSAVCIYLKNTEIPRSILWYGVKHFGFYNTDGKLEFKDLIFRNPQLLLLMFAAAFPFLKIVLKYTLKLVIVFFKSPQELLAQNNSSGLQLQWVFLKGCEALGFNFDKHNQHHTYAKAMFSQYYGEGHPFRSL